MFEHLDDPHPPALGHGFRRAAVERGRRRRRRRRLAGAAGVTVASLVVGVGGLYGRVVWKAGQIDRVDVASTGRVAAGEPITVLVVGSDARGGAAVGSTDTILVVRVDPDAGTAALLSLPRDLMVEAPDGAGRVTINSVAATDGLGALVSVVESQVGVPLDHVVHVGFDGFRSLVDRVGGVQVRVDTPVRDTGSGLFLDELGCVALDGEEALALVRSRKVEVLDASGAWVRDPLSDVRRVETQRQVLVAALASLADVSLDPVTLEGHVDWAVDHVAVDASLGRDEIVRLAGVLAGLDPAAVSSATVPVVSDPADVNRLVLDPSAAPAVIEAFGAGRPLPASGPVDPAGLGSTDIPGGSIVDPC